MSALSLPHGLHQAIPGDVYHAREPGVASKTALDLVRRSPAHYKAWLDGHDEEETPALKLGSAFHCASVEPDRFAVAYAVEPDFGDCRFKANKERRDAWRADHAGAIPLSADDGDRIRAMVRAVHEHPLAGKMIRDGDPELTLRWKDEETGLECKARADYHVRRHRMAVDLKSSIDASPAAFPKAAANYGYHRQDAFYRSGFAAVGEPVDHFIFIVVEKEPPHAVAIYALDGNDVALGLLQVRRDMARLAECVRENKWPGYEPTIQTLKLPPWAA